MNLHHVDHSGANRKYYLGVLNYIHNHDYDYGVSISQASLGEFIEKGIPKGTDVLSYQTFPDEFNPKKFNKDTIYKSDLIFHAFKGKKVIVDARDCGDEDGFSRMYAGKELPRVKSYPSYRFLKNYNVILISTVSANPGVTGDQSKYDRIITISCKFGKHPNGFYGHLIREVVEGYLKESFWKIVNFEWASKREYFNELRWTKIVIGAPGWGAHNSSYWGALKAGALLFAHRTLNDIKLFPHSDLIDGDDYVSYDLYNFKRKLQRLLDRPDEVERIRNNGRKKYQEGLNYKKSADQLVNYLKGESK